MQDYPFLPLILIIVSEILASATQQEEKTTGIHVREEELKPYFQMPWPFYRENFMKSTKNNKSVCQVCRILYENVKINGIYQYWE